MSVAVVVGGGAAGALASLRLLATGWEVVLVDPGARPGRGIAYGTAAKWHLLNSPVRMMSAHADRPDDFLRWCRLRCPSTQPHDFVPRGWYGEYLSDALERAGNGRLTIHRALVTRVFASAGSGYVVLLSEGIVVPAAQVVLALGNALPDDPVPATAGQPSYVADPWAPDAFEHLADGPVLLIGTGLTAYDVILTLARRHPGRRIVAVSRHGLTPLPHKSHSSFDAPPVSPGPLATVMRELRSFGGDWRAVMDAHRPHWNALWHGLTEPEQRRFLRHAARYWEVHRHRAAPAVAAEVGALRANGTLEIRAGEVCGLAPDERGGLFATMRYGGGIVTQRFAAAVNCTGPGRLVDSSPLVRSLIAEGLVRPGPFRLGLDADADGALVRRDGSVNRALWTLGPPRRGVLWETTAAPEIRDQAQRLASRIGAPVERPALSSRRMP